MQEGLTKPTLNSPPTGTHSSPSFAYCPKATGLLNPGQMDCPVPGEPFMGAPFATIHWPGSSNSLFQKILDTSYRPPSLSHLPLVFPSMFNSVLTRSYTPLKTPKSSAKPEIVSWFGMSHKQVHVLRSLYPFGLGSVFKSSKYSGTVILLHVLFDITLYIS